MCQDNFSPDITCCRMPPKKWTAVVQDDKEIVVGKVVLGDDIQDICDFRDAAMENQAFQMHLTSHAADLNIYVKSGEELRKLRMEDSVSEITNFGNDRATSILIVLPPVPGELF